MPRQYSLVRYTGPTPDYASRNLFVFLGEIPNKPGHCVVVGVSKRDYGKIITGLPTSDFTELTEEEV